MTHKNFEAPIMPTGSGVADLEIAREQSALANGIAAEADTSDGVAMDEAANDPRAESEAHPS